MVEALQEPAQPDTHQGMELLPPAGPAPSARLSSAADGASGPPALDAQLSAPSTSQVDKPPERPVTPDSHSLTAGRASGTADGASGPPTADVQLSEPFPSQAYLQPPESPRRALQLATDFAARAGVNLERAHEAADMLDAEQRRVEALHVFVDFEEAITMANTVIWQGAYRAAVFADMPSFLELVAYDCPNYGEPPS